MNSASQRAVSGRMTQAAVARRGFGISELAEKAMAIQTTGQFPQLASKPAKKTGKKGGRSGK